MTFASSSLVSSSLHLPPLAFPSVVVIIMPFAQLNWQPRAEHNTASRLAALPVFCSRLLCIRQASCTSRLELSDSNCCRFRPSAFPDLHGSALRLASSFNPSHVQQQRSGQKWSTAASPRKESYYHPPGEEPRAPGGLPLPPRSASSSSSPVLEPAWE